jgi:preprotein translocase subunit SecY
MLDKLKNAWKSWTIWLNTIALAIIAALPDLLASFPQLQGYLPDNMYRAGMGFLIVLNIALRFKTNAPLNAK